MGAYTRTFALTYGTTAYGSQVGSELDALGTSVNNIVDAQIASGANISGSKLAQIVTPSKVSGAAITLLTSVPSGAGELPATNLNIASQAEMETATSTETLVTSGRTQYHPGVSKAWCNFNGVTPAMRASHNVDSSITDHAAGQYTVTITTDFSSADFAIASFVEHSSTNELYVCATSTQAVLAGAVRVKCNLAEDPLGVSLVMFGDQ